MLGGFITTIAAGETANVIGRLKRAAIAYSIAAFLLLLAVTFGLIAAYVWIAREMGAIAAALSFAAGFVVVAIAIIVVHAATAKAQARRAARKRAVDVKALATTAAVAALPGLLANPRSAMALVIPVIGVVSYLIYKENTPQRRSVRRSRPRGISP